MKEGDYLISNQEILGGLKAAIGRGETLKDAMMTFYQAGYDKYEIEEAARAYMNQQQSGSQLNASQRIATPATTPQKPKEEEKKETPATPKKPIAPTKPIVTAPATPKPGVPAAPKTEAKSVQKVSSYGGNKEKEMAGKTLTVALTLVLLLLLGVLAAVFLFKEDLIVFFNNLFG